MLGFGIDFGTSNSTVACFDGQKLRYLDIDPAAVAPEVMPTALYLDRAHGSEIGQAAIESYVRQNAGRSIRLTPEDVGQIRVSVAGTDSTRGFDEGGAITEEFRVHAWTDREMPGRLFRSVKRWLGDRSVEDVRVFDTRYRLVALATPILVRLREQADRARGGRSVCTYVGRPVRYQGRAPDASRVALARMREACGYAGLGEATLYPEPAAAALSFLHGGNARSGQTVLAFDFGGGTLDLCLLRVRSEGFEHLAAHGIGLGGDDIDRLVCRAKVFPELGAGTTVHRPIGPELREEPFPFGDFSDRLLNWPLAYELNRPELLETIVQGAREPGETGRKLARLHALVTGNQAYGVFQAVEQAKIALSESEHARIEVPEIDLSVAIRRAELESLLAPLLARIETCVRETLDAARLAPQAVDIVVRTGGSARIPAVARRLEDIFPGRVVEHDPFTSIAAGLAIASFLGSPPPQSVAA